jgi:hypothetical protein
VLLTGLSSGACQELLRQRVSGRQVRLARCLRASLRHGLQHVAARVLSLTIFVLGSVLAVKAVRALELPPASTIVVGGILSTVLVGPGLLLWLGLVVIHPVIATGGLTLGEVFRVAWQEVWQQPGKAFAILATRVLLFIIAGLNLHALVLLTLGFADSFLGLNVAYAQHLLTLGNLTYFLALLLLTHVLLAPYFEVVHYLFHLDARTRYEGLDLWFRVQRQFPAPPKAVTAAALALAAVLVPFVRAPARADDLADPRAAVGQLRKDVRALTEGPFPSGSAWAGPLTRAADKAVAAGAPEVVKDWCSEAAKRLRAAADEANARQVLADLDSRLELLERSLVAPGGRPDKDRVKALAGAGEWDTAPRPKPKPPPPPPPEPPPRTQRVSEGPAVDSASSGGLSLPWQGIAWFFLAAAVVVVVAALARGLLSRERKKDLVAQVVGTPLADDLEKLLEEAPDVRKERWKRADELAQEGQYLEAVRMLYLMVLVLLHQANLIRYERMRTNGEYVQMLRRRAVQQPFRQLTRLFEVKWYGQRPCAWPDYEAGRNLADAIFEDVHRHG